MQTQRQLHVQGTRLLHWTATPAAFVFFISSPHLLLITSSFPFPPSFSPAVPVSAGTWAEVQGLPCASTPAHLCSIEWLEIKRHLLFPEDQILHSAISPQQESPHLVLAPSPTVSDWTGFYSRGSFFVFCSFLLVSGFSL